MKQGPFTETYISTVFGIFSLFQISKAVNKNLKVSWRETLSVWLTRELTYCQIGSEVYIYITQVEILLSFMS